MVPSSVLVVGAGPTGLALSCGLRAHGIPVRLVDAATGPAGTSRALGLQPRGVEVLDRLGALGDLPHRSLPIHQVVVSIGGREVGWLAVGHLTAPEHVWWINAARRRSTRDKPVRRPGLLVSQAVVEGALRNRLRELDTEVEWGHGVTELHQYGDGVDVRLGDGEVTRAGWVVGCDGAHSVARKAAGIGFPGVPLVERFLLADVTADLPIPRDTVAVWLDGAEMLGAFPLPGDRRWRLMAPAPDADVDPLPALTAMLVRHAGVPASTITETHWTSTFRFHRRLADTYRRGRVLLAGDAAHIHSPFGGQGLNTGIGDAENLAWKLALVADGHATEELLDIYEAERRPIAADVLASTTGMTRLVLGGSTMARLIRDHVFVPLMNLPPVQRMIWERSSQLTISYRGGPLGRRRLRGPHPGDRVPDLDVRRDGAPARLHAALGGHWAVVGADPGLRDGCAAVAGRHLGAERVVGLASPGASREVLLVRPDAHLAWRGTDPAAMRRWLTGALGQPAVHAAAR